MQDFFNLGDEEENAKLIWCIGKKKKKISNFDKTNWYWDFSNKSLRFNSVGAEPFPSLDCCRARGAMDGGMELFASTGWALWPDHMPHQA